MGYRNSRAAERTLAALRNVGRLEQVDEATIGALRTLAAALDVVDPVERPAQLASLARVYLAAIRQVRGLVDDDGDDGISDWIAGLSSTMGDAPES